MPFQNVTDIVLNEETQELEDMCERDPEIKKAIEKFDSEFDEKLAKITKKD